MIAKIKKYFTFQYKAMLVLALLVSIPFMLTGYLVQNFTESQRIQEKENKLLTITRILADHLGAEGYAGILREHHAADASREQKIKVLNEVLQPFTESVAATSPHLGVGYYSRELDAILTYGPAAQHGHTVGTPISPEHPGRTVMETGQSIVRSGSMVRGSILNAMLPFTHEGKVIGYIWANEPLTNIQVQLDAIKTHIFTVMLTYGALCLGLLFVLSRRTLRDIDRIISGLRAMRTDFSQRIPDSRGELGEVARAINAMAEAVGETNAHLESKIAERTQQLETERSFLRTVLDAIPDMVFYKSPDGRYLTANIAFATLVGKTKDGLVGLNDVELFGDTPHAAHFCAIDQRAMRERTVVRLEERVTTPDGKTHELETIKTPCLDAQGTVVGLLGISRDNIARKALEQALISAREDALAASQAKSDFLANMSHEIRTPMSGIIGLVYLALNHADVTPRLRDYLQKVDMSAKSLLRIINDILDFSKIEAGKLEMEHVVFSLPEVLEKTIQPLVVEITSKGLEIKIDIAADVPNHLVGDPTRLGQVVLNLVSNALKFTHEGSILVGVDLVQDVAQEATLRINVTDTGIGMAPVALSRLFESFTQADTSITRRYGGTGLGLTISKRLVELMGGSIAVTSSLGKGTTFTITARFGVAPASAIPHELCDSLLNKTVLVADDNPISRRILRGYLEGFGVLVEETGDAHEALERMSEKDRANDEYFAVVVDWKMPDMDGLSLVQQARSSMPQRRTPFILVTAYDRSGLRNEAHSMGVQEVLIKPVTPSGLLEALMRAAGVAFDAADADVFVAEVDETTTERKSGGAMGSKDGAGAAAHNAHPAAASGDSSAQPPSPLQKLVGKTVLLAEDNEINQLVVQEILQGYGMQVRVATNGREAVDMARSEHVDLIFMDVQMPEMDGISATRCIREDASLGHIPIIAMTAHAMSGDVEKSLAAGMQDHITKPLDLALLQETLLRWVR